MNHDEYSPRYTRSQARAKRQAMDDGIEPGDSISQISKERSHVSVTSRTTHSTSSYGSGRSKEQLDLDISKLAIKMSSQEKKAQLKRSKLELKKRKLEVDLDVEKTDLKEQMDIAKAEREMLEGSSSSGLGVERNRPIEAEINKMLDECYTFLGAGKVDGTKACRVYCPSTTKQKATRETQEKPKNPRTQEEPRRTNIPASDKNTQSVKDKIGYFPSPTRKSPDQNPDNSLEALYRQQAVMMGALQAPKIELLDFTGDPMQYHAFIRSFEENVEKMLSDDGACLARLIHLCKGEAGRAVRCCSLMDPELGYARARHILEQRFGDKHTITELWIKRLNDGGPRVNLQEYADELLECYESLNALGALQEMNAQRTLLTMITRLPIHLQNKWQDYVFDLRSLRDRRPTLKDVVDFVGRAAAVMSDPVYGSASMRGRRVERTPTRMTYAATADVRCPICDDGEHSVPQCRRFIEMNASDRLDVALKRQICFMCLTPGHITRECSNPVKCQERGCGQRHATILHDADWEGLRRARREKRDAEARGLGSNSSAPEGHHVSSSHHVMGKKVALPFLLVNVTSPETGISIKTYALLDSGSNVSLCQDKLLHLLKAHGRTERLSLTTLDKESNETTAQVISLRISNLDGSDELTIPQVFARPSLRLSSSNLVTEAEVQKWPHLKDLPLHHAEIDDVTLLIGQDCPEALIPLTTVPGGKGGPYAVRTRLGWSVSGPVSNSVARLSSSHYISNEDLLQEKVDRFWKLESSGIYEQESTMSVDDRRVLALWDEKVSFSGGHYVLPIPFKSSTLKLPDNRQMAEKRLSSLRRKLEKNKDLHQKYVDGKSDLLEQGYAVPVPEQDVHRSDGKVWYLPPHPVINPNKEKIRIVFDCAAEYGGVSLNSRIRLRHVLHDGILVVPGRLTHANLPSHAKKPVILPSRHPMVGSLVRHVHERTTHSGRGHALAELHRKYWIVGATSLVRKVIRHCVTCRRRDAQTCQQMEADLPLDRVTPYEPAFTSVRVDYFGPFAVKRGRGREKRYGCLFTCPTTRAVHIETADTLDTDSFINCLYRFMARRGEPRLIRSDNGTNFVGAERELRKEMEAWNKDRIQEVMSRRGSRWMFNPPAASHMGGVWERQIGLFVKSCSP